MGRLIDADKFKEYLIKGTEDALQVAYVQGFLTKEKEKQADQVLKGFLQDIDEQPTVNGWIPVKEQLPKAKKKPAVRVLVSYLNESEQGTYFPRLGLWYGNHGNDITEIVEAWKPLPEPYKRE